MNSNHVPIINPNGKQRINKLYVKLIPIDRNKVNAVGSSVSGATLNLKRLKNNFLRIIMLKRLKRFIKNGAYHGNMSSEDIEAAKALESLSTSGRSSIRESVTSHQPPVRLNCREPKKPASKCRKNVKKIHSEKDEINSSSTGKRSNESISSDSKYRKAYKGNEAAPLYPLMSVSNAEKLAIDNTVNDKSNFSNESTSRSSDCDKHNNNSIAGSTTSNNNNSVFKDIKSEISKPRYKYKKFKLSHNSEEDRNRIENKLSPTRSSDIKLTENGPVVLNNSSEINISSDINVKRTPINMDILRTSSTNKDSKPILNFRMLKPKAKPNIPKNYRRVNKPKMELAEETSVDGNDLSTNCLKLQENKILTLQSEKGSDFNTPNEAIGHVSSDIERISNCTITAEVRTEEMDHLSPSKDAILHKITSENDEIYINEISDCVLSNMAKTLSNDEYQLFRDIEMDDETEIDDNKHVIPEGICTNEMQSLSSPKNNLMQPGEIAEEDKVENIPLKTGLKPSLQDVINNSTLFQTAIACKKDIGKIIPISNNIWYYNESKLKVGITNNNDLNYKIVPFVKTDPEASTSKTKNDSMITRSTFKSKYLRTYPTKKFKAVNGPGDKKFQCYYCFKILNYRANFIKHIKMLHYKEIGLKKRPNMKKRNKCFVKKKSEYKLKSFKEFKMKSYLYESKNDLTDVEKTNNVELISCLSDKRNYTNKKKKSVKFAPEVSKNTRGKKPMDNWQVESIVTGLCQNIIQKDTTECTKIGSNNIHINFRGKQLNFDTKLTKTSDNNETYKINCIKCNDDIYYTESLLKKHLTEKHYIHQAGSIKLICSICFTGFDDLAAHMKQHHPQNNISIAPYNLFGHPT